MAVDFTFILVVAATASVGLLAGASPDQSIRQLPARRRIGAVAYSQYSRAAGLGNGIFFYGILGVVAALLNIAAAIAAYWARSFVSSRESNLCWRFVCRIALPNHDTGCSDQFPPTQSCGR
jgi:hypothetical protein